MRKAGGRNWDPILAAAVRQRLIDHIDANFGGNKSSFARALGVKWPTVHGWIRGKGYHLPEVTQLVRIAKRTNLNLNWLLLGTYPAFRGELVSSGEIGSELRAALVTDLGGELGGAERVSAALPDGDVLFVCLRNLAREFVRRFPETATTPFVHKAVEPLVKAHRAPKRS